MTYVDIYDSCDVVSYLLLDIIVKFLPQRESKKLHMTFDNNIGKCRLIFKILSLTDSQRNPLGNYYHVFHLALTVLLHYFAEFKNLK